MKSINMKREDPPTPATMSQCEALSVEKLIDDKVGVTAVAGIICDKQGRYKNKEVVIVGDSHKNFNEICKLAGNMRLKGKDEEYK